MANSELTYEQLRTLYAWIDAIPLSRPKRNICRDFSDGVMIAEIIAAYYPALIELHNYPPANSTKQKIYNFETLNQRVLKRFNYQIPHHVIEDIVNCKPGAVEVVLNTLQFKMAKYRERKESDISPPVSARRPQPQSLPEKQEVFDKISINKPNHSKIEVQKTPGNVVTAAKATVDAEILLEKEQIIRELTDNVEILELKVAKLEQLVRLKDSKIQKLMNQQAK